MDSPIKVIYILGSGHSGSTLLDVILGTHSRVEGVGEIDRYEEYFTDNAVRPPERRRCSCALPVSECEFWARVGRGLTARLGAAAVSLRAPTADEFEAFNAAVFEAVLETAGKQYVCDSSKRRPRLQRLLQADRFEVYIVHLVRDGRAVVQSQRARTGAYPLIALLRWARSNLYSFIKFHRSERYQVLRYEDLVADPAGVLGPLLDRAGLQFEPDQLAHFSRRVAHNLSGSGVRFEGWRRIHGNARYLQELSSLEWLLGTLLGLPALLFFRYSLFRSGMRRMIVSSSAAE